ncbi:Acetyl-coenzyme A synthetase [Plasmodiophora brassicae]
MTAAEVSVAHVDDEIYPPPEAVRKAGPAVRSLDHYHEIYNRSVSDPVGFWSDIATQQVTFFTPYSDTMTGSFQHGDVAWFVNGKLNACYNAVDRHLPARANKTAIIYQGDEFDDVRRISYQELYHEVCRLANVLRSLGVKKGDRVCIYMPMCPESAIALLACARIGAPHNVVFAGFSTDAIRDRILDAHATVVICANESVRGGKTVPLKAAVDKAVAQCPCVEHVLVYKQTDAPCPMTPQRDIDLREAMSQQRPYCPCEIMDSEDTLFMLYTSGSTGRPKGIIHTTGGYCVWASYTHRIIFDLHEDDVYACVADIGWITGHSYIVYGPLINGATTLMFQSTPLYPNPSRYWDLVQRHKISIFYTAPTAIRALMRFGDAPFKGYDLSSLRILGSVGEPINPEAWKWYHKNAGGGKCAIVDTYWQTETGGIMVSPIPGATPTKPGSATLPFFGVKLALRDPMSGTVIDGNGVSGILTVEKPWPGMARTIHGDHSRYLLVYMNPYPGSYLTGDGATRDKNGYYWITGRVDDVLNVSGHRIGSAEVESALVQHPSVAEAAVVGRPHTVKGECLFAYVTVKENVAASPELVVALQNSVRECVGAFARPDEIVITPALPKTRSGKIMRRLLRKLASREFDPKGFGDVTTLMDPSVVDFLITEVKKLPPI